MEAEAVTPREYAADGPLGVRARRRLAQARHDVQSSAGLMFVVAVLTITLFSLTQTGFASLLNVNAIAQSLAVTGMVGLAQMVVIGSGGMDLSIGGVGGLVAVVTGGLMANHGFSPAQAIVTGLLLGLGCGMVNGVLINLMGGGVVAAFVVTLASGSLFTGIDLGITKAIPYYDLPTGFTGFGSATVGGIYAGIAVGLVVAVGLWAVFRWVGLGRQILTIGANLRAARLTGVPVSRVIVCTYGLSALIGGGAAILLTTQLGLAQPGLGSDWLLGSFAAPILGGARLAGGKISVSGTMFGALVLALIADVLVFLNVSPYWNQFIAGTTILIAVAFERLRVARAERRVHGRT